MNWGEIIIAALSGGAIVKVLDVIAVRLNLKHADTASAFQVLISRIDRLNARVDKYEKTIAELEAERLKTSKELALARQENVEKDARIHALEQENCDLKAALEQMRIDIAARDKQIDNLERQVVKLLARVDDLEGR